MIGCLSVQRVLRASLVAFPISILVMAAGCTDEYPPNMRYALRSEPLFVGKITTSPRHWDKPGDFPQYMLAALPSDERNDAAKAFVSPNDVSAAADAQLDAALETLFGTPFEPRVGGITDEVRATLKLDDRTLANGSVHYRSHCLHCHGLSGNGRGPTAPWVNPHPRDYRQGIFKFTSTKGGNERKPRRDDLLRTVRQGIEGTSMPSFGLLPDPDQEALVSYVIHLSLRGNVEFLLIRNLIDNVIDASEVTAKAGEFLEGVVGYWNVAAQESSVITPDPTFPIPGGDERRQSIVRGWDLFRKPGDAGCIGCHVDYGRQSLLFYDDWGTIGRPPDLTTGVYRGGRRRIDVYWRIFGGVNGSSMPQYENLLASPTYRTENKHDGVWDLVNFLEVLPYKKMREEMGIQID